MKKYSVYMHKCLKNNKVYIGLTNNPERRWRSGGIEYKPPKGENQNGRKFWNAIQKYGWTNFESVILEYGLTFEQAIEVEIGYIDLYDSTNRKYGYNISKGGNGGRVYEEHPRGMLGKKQTEHQIASHKEWSSDPENNCMKNGKVIWGKTHEHPRGMKGKTHSDEYKKRLSETMSGGKHPKAKKYTISLNGETKIFDCTKDCMKYLGVSVSIFYKLLRSGMPYVVSKNNRHKNRHTHLAGLVIRYYDSENTEVNNQIAKG